MLVHVVESEGPGVVHLVVKSDTEKVVLAVNMDTLSSVTIFDRQFWHTPQGSARHVPIWTQESKPLASVQVQLTAVSPTAMLQNWPVEQLAFSLQHKSTQCFRHKHTSGTSSSSTWWMQQQAKQKPRLMAAVTAPAATIAHIQGCWVGGHRVAATDALLCAAAERTSEGINCQAGAGQAGRLALLQEHADGASPAALVALEAADNALLSQGARCCRPGGVHCAVGVEITAEDIRSAG